MSLKANIYTDSNGDILVHMSGGLDYETTAPIDLELKELARTNPRCTIILDLHHVDFVGSSGIGQFVETLNFLGSKTQKLKLINVKPEFQKVFKLYQLKNLEQLLNQFETDETEDLAQWSARPRTFEN
jgi:anti-sigma B factor antagonist